MAQQTVGEGGNSAYLKNHEEQEKREKGAAQAAAQGVALGAKIGGEAARPQEVSSPFAGPVFSPLLGSGMQEINYFSDFPFQLPTFQNAMAQNELFQDGFSRGNLLPGVPPDSNLQQKSQLEESAGVLEDPEAKGWRAQKSETVNLSEGKIEEPWASTPGSFEEDFDFIESEIGQLEQDKEALSEEIRILESEMNNKERELAQGLLNLEDEERRLDEEGLYYTEPEYRQAVRSSEEKRSNLNKAMEEYLKVCGNNNRVEEYLLVVWDYQQVLQSLEEMKEERETLSEENQKGAAERASALLSLLPSEEEIRKKQESSQATTEVLESYLSGVEETLREARLEGEEYIDPSTGMTKNRWVTLRFEKQQTEKRLSELQKQNEDYAKQLDLLQFLGHFDNPGEDIIAFYLDFSDLLGKEDLLRLADFMQMKNEEDFTYYANLGGSMENPTAKEAEFGVFEDGYRFVKKKPNNIVTYSRDNAAELLKLENLYGQAEGSTRYCYLTENETRVYNFLLGKGDTEQAQEFLKLMDDILLRRKGMDYAQEILSMEPGINREITIGINAFSSGARSWAQGIEQIFHREALPTEDWQYEAQSVRNGLEGGEAIWYDFANSAGNTAPSVLMSALLSPIGVGSAAGSMAMGVSTAGNAYNQKLKEGYDEGQARIYALLVGASEGYGQYLIGGISKLGGKLNTTAFAERIAGIDNAFLRAGANLGESALSEAFEEGLQTIVEPIYASLVFQEEYTPAELEDIVYSMLMGGLSSLVFEGPGVAASEFKESSARNRGRALDSKAVESIIEFGLQKGEETAEYRAAETLQNMLDSGEEINAYLLGNILCEAVVETQGNSEERYESVSKGVAELLEGTGSYDRLQEFLLGELEQEGFLNSLQRNEAKLGNGKLSEEEINRNLTEAYLRKGVLQDEREIQRIAKHDPALALEIENAFLEIAERTQDPGQRAELLKTAGSYDSIIQDVTDAKKGNPVRKRLWKNESLLLTAENPEIEAQIAQKLLDSEQISRYNEKQKRLSEGELFEDVFSGETKVVWPEKAHKNWTEGHWETIQAGVKILLQTGDYSVIYVNRGLSNEVPGIRPNRRPDIMAVRKDGTIEQFEVMSKSDTMGELRDRVTDTQSRLGERGGRYKIIDIPEKWKGSTW